jgi:PAS domain S-box-containing protein
MDLSTVQTKCAIGKPSAHGALPALWAGAFYFIGAEIGAMMAAAPVPITQLRPGGAILLAAFLVSPVRGWWGIVLAAFAAHLGASLHGGVPLAASLAWFVGNSTQALLGAGGVGWMLRQPLRFDLLRHVLVFVCWCAFLAPAASSLLEVGLLRATGAQAGAFWQAWTARVVSSAAVLLAIVPVRINWPAGTLKHIASHTWPRQLEAGLLVFALLGLGGVAFVRGVVPSQLVPLLTYAPLLLLFWTVLRFGAFGEGLAFLLFAVFVVVGTALGAGPFAVDAYSGRALFLPLFLIATAVPMLLLSAALHERRGTLAALMQEQEKLGLALAAERKRAERLARERHARAEVEQRVAERTVELRRANQVLRAEIAGRKKALDAERVAAARFSNLFRLSPDAMSISMSLRGPLLDVNGRWQQLFGYTRDEVLGLSAEQLNLYATPAQLPAMVEALDTDGTIRDLDVRMRNRQGHILQTMLSGVTIVSGVETCFLAIVRDVTGQRLAAAEAQRQREELTHLSRVVVLGELSGALAHELNQPLAAILANAQAARRFLARPCADLHEIQEILNDIVQEDKRAGDVIRRLRALFKKGEPILRPVAVAELVQDVLALTHGNLVERSVDVRLELADGLTVRGDRVQLQQVLLNLIVNACDAMRMTPPRRRRLRLASALAPDGRIQVTVADSGPGIAPELAGKIFDPFFTTKTEGLGFGLSISRAIIAQHGGKIEAANLPAGGCAFSIGLPAYSGEK